MIVINVAPEKPKQRRPRFQTSNGGNAGRGLSNLSTSTLQGELLRESLTGLRDRNMMARNQVVEPVTDRRDNFDVADTLGGNNFIAQGNPTSFYKPTDNPSIRATPNYLVDPEPVSEPESEPEPEPESENREQNERAMMRREEVITRLRNSIDNFSDILEKIKYDEALKSREEKAKFKQLYKYISGRDIKNVTRAKLNEIRRIFSKLPDF
jgi:hypothetical protein